MLSMKDLRVLFIFLVLKEEKDEHKKAKATLNKDYFVIIIMSKSEALKEYL